MKKITIIGASGFVGSALLYEAIGRDFTIQAIARDKSKITQEHPLLSKIELDVFDTPKLTEALKGQEVVISAYNSGWTNPNIYADFMKGANSIQNAAKQADVKRYLVIGGAGSLEVAPGKQLVDQAGFPGDYKQGATAARDYLNELKKEKNIDWAFFSPPPEMHPGITDGRTGKYRIGKDSLLTDEEGKSRLSVEDLAVVIMDEVETPSINHARFTAAY